MQPAAAVKLSNQMRHLREDLTHGAPDMYRIQLRCQVQDCTSAALCDILTSLPSAVQLAVKYHPDKAKGDRAQAEEKFKDLSSAYATLSGEVNTCAQSEQDTRVLAECCRQRACIVPAEHASSSNRHSASMLLCPGAGPTTG